MKKKLVIALVILLAVAVLLAACNSDGSAGDRGAPGSSDGGLGNDFSVNDVNFVSARKIIYEVSFDLTCDDINQARALIKSSIDKSGGEWFEKEIDYDGRSYFVARVKSDRLDEFTAAVSAGGERKSYNKTATDISLNYFDKQAKIEDLQAERAAYNKLLDDAKTMSDIMMLTAKVTQLNGQINALQSELNQFDGKLDYSTVTINLYEKYTYAAPSRNPFGQRLGNAFKGGWNALLTMLDALFIALVAVFPFLLLGGGMFTGIYFLVKADKKRKKKRAADKNSVL